MKILETIKLKKYYGQERFRCGLDIIVIARIGAKGKDYKDIVGAMLHLGHLHKIIDEG